MISFRYAIFCLFALILAGCAGRPAPVPMEPVTLAGEAASRWQAFTETSERSLAPGTLSGSLRFGPPDDTRRVTWLLWGNGGAPFRLDIQAGVGATIAKVQVNNDTVLFYLPREERAYIGSDGPDNALARLGMPLPLGLAQLEQYLWGNYARAMGGAAPTAVRRTEDGRNFVYSLNSPQGLTEIELASGGLPVRWSEPGRWDVFMDYDDAGLPRKVEGRLGPAGVGVREGMADYRMIMLVKNRQPSAPFSPSELELPLPQGTPVFSLDD